MKLKTHDEKLLRTESRILLRLSIRRVSCISFGYSACLRNLIGIRALDTYDQIGERLEYCLLRNSERY